MKVAIVNNKGGILKSTSVINIASLLYLEGKRVLIIDADNQGNIAVSYGIDPDTVENSFYDVMMQRCHFKDAIMTAYGEPGGSRIDIIPSNDDTASIEFEVLPNKERNNFTILKDAIAGIEHEYDAVIIDSPPNMGLMMGNVLTAATHILIPFQPEPYSMRSLVKIVQAVRDFKALHNSELDLIGVFSTLVDNRTNVHADIIANAKEFAKENNFVMFETEIPRSIREPDAIAYHNLPLALVNKKAQSVQEYIKLVKECRKRGILV